MASFVSLNVVEPETFQNKKRRVKWKMLEGEEKEEESWITRLSPLKATSLFLQE